MTEETNPVGRPTLYRPEYCERVIELGREGRSKAQMASRLDVCCNTLDNWAKENPEFLSALTRARDLAKAWWEDKGQDNLTSSVFQTGLWSRSMAARFPDDYTERQKKEHSGPDGGPVQISRVERVIVRSPTNSDG